MRHVMEKTLHNAYSALDAANRKLEKGRMTTAEARELMDVADRAHAMIERHKRMDNTMPYTDTNIGYRTTDREYRNTSNDANDTVRAFMDLANRILPPIADDDDYDVDDRRGVPGTGRRRVRRVRADRYDDRYDTDDRYDDSRYRTDDDRYDDADDMKVYNMPRWRSARTGRFLPNLYGPRRVRRVRRRSDMDNRYNTDDRYDDDRYDDDKYDDIRRTTYEARRTTDDARRTADDARRAVDEARRTVDDVRGISPVMRTERTRYDDTRNDRRYETRTDDEAHRPGPAMTR